LSSSKNDDKVVWYENDGNQNFTSHIITENADGASSVFALDIDWDGDIDILSSSYNDNKISWYENNGSQTFIEHIISNTAYGANSIYCLDMDGDEDIDVLSAANNDDENDWYENDSNQNFTKRKLSIKYGYSVYGTDLDDDEDIDLLYVSSKFNRISWYENTGIVSVPNSNTTPANKYFLNNNYPNPFNSSTIISYSIQKSSFVTLKIFDVFGKEIKTLVSESQKPSYYTINFYANNISSGIYFYKLQVDNKYTETKKMVIIQ